VASETNAPPRWLLLIHHIPPKPAYLRVKVGRRLQQIGAVPIKNSVYALPRSDGAQEDFHWLVGEIRKGGGDATVCEASFVEGMRDEDVERLFVDARNADYRAVVEVIRSLKGSSDLEGECRRLRGYLEAVVARDFFGAPGRKSAESALQALEARLGPKTPAPASPAVLRKEDYRGRTWVTRTGIHVDRMACAWLIRRFIDPKARFAFVAAKGYVPRKRELRFDMFEGEFTHEGDLCSFETILARFGIGDPALRAIAEIVHDIDLKDGKYRREEAAGIDRLIAGIAMAHKKDVARLARASASLDDLYEYFHRKGR
jgi:hypothetical protein